MKDYQREIWKAAGLPDTESLVGKKFLFSPNSEDMVTKFLLQEGFVAADVRGHVVSQVFQDNSDAHADYTRLKLTIRVESCETPVSADAELHFNYPGSGKWSFWNGLEEDKRYREFFPGTLTFLDL